MPNDAILTYSDYPQSKPVSIGQRSTLFTYREYIEFHYRLNFDEELPEITPPLPPTPVVVDVGRWLFQCRACLTGMPVEPNEPLLCSVCAYGGWMLPAFPDNRAAIEEELLKQPGRRLSAPIRNWLPEWSMEYLQSRTQKAQEAVAAGNPYPRSLSIGTTRIWATGEVLGATNMNTFISEPIKDLAGRNGPVELEDALQLDSLTTTQRNALTAADGMLLYNSTVNKLQARENGAWGNLFNIGKTLEVIGSGNFDITAITAFATQSNSADITIPTAGVNEIWGLVALTEDAIFQGLFLGSWLNDLDDGTYGGPDTGNKSLVAARANNLTAQLKLGHTSADKLLVNVSNSTMLDPMPLVLFRYV